MHSVTNLCTSCEQCFLMKKPGQDHTFMIPFLFSCLKFDLFVYGRA